MKQVSEHRVEEWRARMYRPDGLAAAEDYALGGDESRAAEMLAFLRDVNTRVTFTPFRVLTVTTVTTETTVVDAEPEMGEAHRG